MRVHPWDAARWNSIHGDSRNSDSFSYPTCERYQLLRRELEGAAILFGPAIDARGQRYLCSGRGRGFSHLHALTPDGDILWQADAWEGGTEPSPRLSPFAPLLDEDGGVFVADDRYFWCFESDGKLRWKTGLPALGVKQGFASAIFSPAGHVGGVSLEGTVLLLDRKTGELARPALTLPAGLAPASPPMPAGLWAGGLMDAELAATLYPAFFGFAHPVTNTPAVGVESRRIYVPAAGADPGRSVLYGVEETADGLRVVLASDFQGRCAVTPSLSNDSRIVYTGNSNGVLHAFDAGSGALLWTYSRAGPAASPSVGTDGTVYTGTNTVPGRPSELSALNGMTGEPRWIRSYDELAAEYLPDRPPLKPFFAESCPRAVVNSVQTIGASHLLVVLVLGYTFTSPGSPPMTQPHRVVLASIDPGTGALLGATELPDTSEAAVVLDVDGSVYVSHAALSSSLFYYGINPLLPGSHQTRLVPSGGVSVLKPVQVEASRPGL